MAAGHNCLYEVSSTSFFVSLEQNTVVCLINKKVMNCWHRTNGFPHLYSLLNVSGGHLLAGWDSRKRPRFKHGIYWLCNHMQVTVKPSVLVCLYKVAIVMFALTLRESQ